MSGKELFTKSEFDSKRQHPEFHESCRFANWMKGEIRNGRNITYTTKPFQCAFTHFPNEGAHGKEGFFAKLMGVREGIDDYIVWWSVAQTGFLEFKVKGRPQRPSQIGFDSAMKGFGFKNREVVYTTEEARDYLIAWGVPYTPVPIPPRKLTHAEQLAAQWEWSRPSE